MTRQVAHRHWQHSLIQVKTIHNQVRWLIYSIVSCPLAPSMLVKLSPSLYTQLQQLLQLEKYASALCALCSHLNGYTSSYSGSPKDDAAPPQYTSGPDSALYYSLAKEHPLTKECPPPTFGPTSCTGSKFTQMSTHPGISYAWSLRSTSSALCMSDCKKLHVVLHQRLLQGIFVQTDTANVVCAASYTIVTVTWQFRLLCAVRTRLLNPLVVLLQYIYYLSNYFFGENRVL